MATLSTALPKQTTQNGVVLQWANTIAVIVTIIYNALSQIIPIGVQGNAQLANQYNPYNYFLPANYVFSIWSVIFVGMIVFAWWQSRPQQRENPRFQAIGWWFVIGCLGNIGWLLTFQNLQFTFSMIPLATLLITLGIIYVRIRQAARPAAYPIKTFERVALFGFISLYFAWSAVATVANGAFIFLSAEFGVQNVNMTLITADQMAQFQMWGTIMLVVAGLIGAGVSFFNGDLVYAGVIVWAFVGIMMRQTDTQSIVLAAGIMSAITVAAGIAGLIRERRARAA